MVEMVMNYYRISETLATSGQPVPGELKMMADEGFEVVVNLAMPDSDGALPDEGKRVTEEGMIYIHIPVSWEKPTIRDLELFFDVMLALDGKKVWVHCAKNMRVSCFVYLYCRYVRQVPEAEAAKPMRSIWNPEAYPAWQSLMQEADDFLKPILNMRKQSEKSRI